MNKDIRFVYFGTSDFSVFVLEALRDAGLLPALIVTAPDKPQGRKLVLTPPPVKTWAQEHAIDVVQPERIDDEFLDELRNSEWDLFALASYGKILPRALLEIPRHGILNVHPSLLPKYRGASPIQSQILADDRECGVTIMLMDEELDHGPILSQARIEIEEADWPLSGSELSELLGVEGGNLLAETIPAWLAGSITSEAQDHDAATFTKKIRKEDGELNLDGDARENFLKIKAFDPWPGTYFFTERNGKKMRVKVTDAEFKDLPAPQGTSPARLTASDAQAGAQHAGGRQAGGALIITRVIPEGKKEMAYTDFLRSQ